MRTGLVCNGHTRLIESVLFFHNVTGCLHSTPSPGPRALTSVVFWRAATISAAVKSPKILTDDVDSFQKSNIFFGYEKS